MVLLFVAFVGVDAYCPRFNHMQLPAMIITSCLSPVVVSYALSPVRLDLNQPTMGFTFPSHLLLWLTRKKK